MHLAESPYSIPSSSLLDPYVVMLSAGDCILYPQLLLCWTMRSLNHATTAILTHAVICQDGVPCQIHSQLVDDWILTDFGYAHTILSPITRIIRYYLQCPISSYLSSFVLSYPILSYLSSYMILILSYIILVLHQCSLMIRSNSISPFGTTTTPRHGTSPGEPSTKTATG